MGRRQPESVIGIRPRWRGEHRVRKAENGTQVEAQGLTSRIGMVSFPIDQGQEAAGIEVQVVVVGIWVQTAFRKTEKQGEEAALETGRPVRRLQ